MLTRIASENMWLFNGGTFSTQIWASDSVDLSDWTEVTNDFKIQFELELESSEVDIIALQLQSEAYLNALRALFDGVKYTANPNNPFTIAFPMYVRANMYYSYNSKTYVAVSTGIITGESDMATFLEEADWL